MSESLPTVYLARHGETAWTISRQHTGRMDLPLTARGEDDAWSLHGRLRGLAFDGVFVSPLLRANPTDAITSAAPVQRTMSAGLRSSCRPFQIRLASA